MTIVITMAGMGSRFKKAGYKVPKYMIVSKGRSLFEWSMLSLEGFKSEENKYFFVVRKADDSSCFIKNECEKLAIKNFEIIEIDSLTDGQATTAMLVSEKWNKNSALLIYNIDTYVEENEMNTTQIEGDGFIPCFYGEGTHWSFVKTDESNKAIEIREKDKISDNCTLGAYYFKSCLLYENLYNEYYSSEENMEKGEKYVAPLYNYLISKGGEVKISIVDKKKVHVLGTPEELNIFEQQ